MVVDRTKGLPDIPLSSDDHEPPGPLATQRDLDPAFPLHHGGKIEVRPTVRVRDKGGLALAYTPGVARVASAIAKDPRLAYDYTWKANTVAVVTDGTAVLGLGDIGPIGRPAGDGGQGRAVQGVRRRGRRSDLPGLHGRRRDG